MTVKIVTDSVADIPEALARNLGISVIPIRVRFGDKVYRDGIDISPDQFYHKLISDSEFPHTAVPGPEEIAQVYQKLSEETDQILSVHLSAKYSAFYEAALTAKAMAPGNCRIEVIDTLSAVMGEGLLVITAAKEARNGASMEQIIATLNKLTSKTHVRMAFDTLEYLKRGGRIGTAQALMGSLLRVHPIVGIKEGSGETIGITRAHSREKAINWLYNYARNFSGRIREMAVEYATTPDEADAFIEQLGTFYPKERIYKSQVGCVVGAHVGPHVLSVNLIEDVDKS
jgi:DegV family protein with EDD domain